MKEHERILPHDLDSERSCLGAILVHNDAWDIAAERLTAADFYRVAHARIWTAMQALADRKSAIDFVTLKNELARAGCLEDVGGPAYLASLADGVPRATNIQYYARIVKDKATLRNLIYAANKILTMAYEAEESPADILRQADIAFLALQQRRGSSMTALTSRDILARMEYRVAHRGELTGITTGFASLDELTMGWQKKDLIIVAARPSVGKTVMAANFAVAAAKTGKVGAFFSYEMRREQLEDRILASEAQVAATRLMNGALGADDYTKISAALEVMHTLSLHIDDRSGQTVQEIRTTCRRMQSEHGLDFVVLDYVQLIPGSLGRRGASRNEELTDTSRRLKELAGELDVPILLLSQLTRIDDRRTDPRPKLSDLRDCGSLEQDADTVCFLHRPNHKVSGTTNLIVEKARNGPCGTLNLTMDRDTVTLRDGGEDIPEPAPKAQHRRGRRTGHAPDLPIDAD